MKLTIISEKDEIKEIEFDESINIESMKLVLEIEVIFVYL